MQSGDSYDVIFPGGAINVIISDMFDEYGEKLEVANTNAEITVILRDMPENLASGEWGIIRRKETANDEANANLYCGTCN